MLYPLKFKPILKTAIWGGHRLPAAGKKVPRRLAASADRISESWEISGVRGNLSVAANGFLKSNNLEELTEVYMGDLVGDKIYERYGLEFPVLVKFIDARERLSLQVHPDDELAARHHGCRGKAEMWYVVDCEPDAAVYIGFNRPVSREEYLRAVADGTLTSLLGRYRVRKGDIYYVPAGTIHTIGPGILIAEIQETSDVSYRISDWDRVDADGCPRALHTEEAAEAISFGHTDEHLYMVPAQPNAPREALSTPFFTTNLIRVQGIMQRDYGELDCFVIYVCTEGSVTVRTEGGEERIGALETLLLSAELDEARLTGDGTLLEIYIK